MKLTHTVNGLYDWLMILRENSGVPDAVDTHAH